MTTDFKSRIRWVILLVLVVQTSLTVLLFRYSLTHATEHFISTTIVFCTECLKYTLSLLLLLLQEGFSLKRSWIVYRSEILEKPRQTILLSIPALLYTVQNNILILALKNLDAATYQVTYQLKILTTAGFSVLLLQKQLHFTQWFSLILLTVGVALVQIPGAEVLSIHPERNRLTGLISVLVACFSSGFAGVFYEKLLKTSSQPSVIIRNLQLGVFSLLLSGSGMMISDISEILEKGKFDIILNLYKSIIYFREMGGGVGIYTTHINSII